MVSHPDDLIIGSISSGWHNGIWTLSHPDDLAPVRISSGWLLDTAVCHPDDISYHRMSSGWLSRNWYLIRMSYDNVIMSSGWHRLPFLSHPDEIANFEFPHHAVALQRFCKTQPKWNMLGRIETRELYYVIKSILVSSCLCALSKIRWFFSQPNLIFYKAYATSQKCALMHDARHISVIFKIWAPELLLYILLNYDRFWYNIRWQSKRLR